MAGGTDGDEWLCDLLFETRTALSAAQSHETLAGNLTAALVEASLCRVAWMGATTAGENVTVLSLDAPNRSIEQEKFPETAAPELTTEVIETGDPLVVESRDDPESRALTEEWDLPTAERVVRLPLGNGDTSHGVLTLHTTHDVPAEAGDRLAAVGTAIADRYWALRTAKTLERERSRLETVRSRVSHDFGNPINIASGRLELAAEDCESDHIDHAVDGLAKVETLAEETVRFVEAGTPVETATELSLETIAEDAWRDVKTETATLEVAGGTVRGDPERLDRLCTELFDNAVRHTDGKVHIRVGTLTTGRGLFVADDGAGIPPEQREAVVDLGYTTVDRPGLGLTVAAEIAAAHGWRLSVRESEHGGTRIECRASGLEKRV